MQARLTAAAGEALPPGLPWHCPLPEWPPEIMVDAPRGLSRNVVRFVARGEDVLAVKELVESVAVREYGLLVELGRRELPVVRVAGLVTERDAGSAGLRRALLVTLYLRHSLPFRFVLAGDRSPERALPLLDALAELLVDLHLAGFFWGDCSLSNVLFRRDAGRYAAYLVDAETGELHPRPSDGARRHDIDITFENVAGELMDLQAGGRLAEGLDPVTLAERLIRRYEELWAELSRVETYAAGEQFRVEQRVRRLNEIGFDVKALEVRRSEAGPAMIVRAQVVEPGHHRRRLRRLTGIDAEENQARRLLNDLDRHRACRSHELGRALGEEEAAQGWLDEVYRAALERVPPSERGKLAGPEIFHQLLEHRWYLAERAGHDLPLERVVDDYVAGILAPMPPPQLLPP
jgi:hypothetical protein